MASYLGFFELGAITTHSERLFRQLIYEEVFTNLMVSSLV